MSELPVCKLCGSDPDTNWAPLVTRQDGFGAVTVSVEKFSCSKRTCTLNGVLCTEDQWRLLHSGASDAEQTAQRIASDLMDLGATVHGERASRIQFMVGMWPDDKPAGGLAEKPLAEFIAKRLASEGGESDE